MRLDLADLRLFLCIVDAGSITRGAEHAHLALPSASERLRNMEASVGVPLLERRHRGVTPTEAGEALAHHARLILQQRNAMQDELADFAAGQRGRIVLHANTAALGEFLPERLAPWLAARPQLVLELKERTSEEIVRAIEAGLIEAGIVSDAVDARGLSLEPVAAHRLVLIVPPTHRLAARRQVDFGEVADEVFVGLTQHSALQQHVEWQAERLGRRLNLRVRLPDFAGVCAMVGHGVGLAIVPAAAARLGQRRHGCRTVGLSDAWANRRLCLCYREWAALSAPTQALLAHLRDSAAPLLRSAKQRP